MYKTIVVFATIILFTAMFSQAQTRNGWRSIYDKEGRLARMNYYKDGINITDSSFHFQYHTDNILKGVVNGEVSADIGCTNGSVILFDYTEQLVHYHIKKNGSLVFDCNLKENDSYFASWVDLFDTNTGYWLCDSMTVDNGNLILHKKVGVQKVFFKPKIAFDLASEFNIRLKLPIPNSTSQGIALWWENEKNNLQMEVHSGRSFSIKSFVNGNLITFSNKQIFEKSNASEVDIVIRANMKDIVFQINGTIEKIVPRHEMHKSNNIVLFTNSTEDSKFDDFNLSYVLQDNDQLYSDLWIGKGTGFYITTDGKILTTYDNIAEAKNLRVTGLQNGVRYTLPARVIRQEEDLNLALLQVMAPQFSPFEILPLGYTDHTPASDSKVFCVGYPNAISGKYMPLEVFEGKVLPSISTRSGSRVLELNYRNGMIGAPVFDFYFNILGICSSKGLELKYSEMIDFHANSRLIKAFMGKNEPKLESPHHDKTYDEKYKAATEMVVIIESSILGGRTE